MCLLTTPTPAPTHAMKGAATSLYNNQDTAISNLHFSIGDAEAR